jgi:endonuclease/exonuclease/phosphatase (EEP) superfamily protein YafD
LKVKLWAEWFLGVGLILLSASHWFPFGINLLELLGAFAHATCILSLIITVVSTIMRLWPLTSLSLLAFAISGLLILPHLFTPEMTGDSNFSVGQFNVYHNNPIPQDAIVALAQNAPDIFTIQELNSEWKSTIDSLVLPTHPYHIEEYWNNCCYGIGVYSKYPIIDSRLLELEKIPAIECTINVNGQRLSLLSLHTFPPAFPDQTEQRNQQLQQAELIIAAMDSPLLIVGDLNLVSWNRTLTQFTQSQKLKSARKGLMATYPMDFGFPLIPIDHILYKGAITPTHCETFCIPGSDHKGLIASFTFKD